jgi:sigma-B regulation protein RsbU (phosphoserine phosphatase)
MENKYITRDYIKKYFQLGDTEADQEKLERITSHMVMRQFPNNTIIRHYGEVSDTMYFIESGKVFALGEDNKTVKNELIEGQYFGEYSLLTGDKSLAAIKTKGHVVLYELDKASVFELISDNPKLLGFFLKHSYQTAENIYAELQIEKKSHGKIMGLNLFRNIKIGTKILAVVLFTSLVTLLIISSISYTQMLNLTKYSQDANIRLGITASDKSVESLIDLTIMYLQSLSYEQADWSNIVLQRVRMETTAMTKFVEWLYLDHPRFTGKPVPFIPDAPPGIPMAKYMFAPGVNRTDALNDELRKISTAEYAFSAIFENNTIIDNIYLGTETGISYRYSRSNAYDPTYDPRARDWYRSAMQNPDTTIWLDTYLDAYGSICVTCARAYRNEKGALIGVVACDITLTQIVEKILGMRVGRDGYSFLLDQYGAYIAHPRYGEPGFITQPLTIAEGSWRSALQEMVAGKYGAYTVDLDGEAFLISSAPLEETGWILCTGIHEEVVVAPAVETKAEIDLFTDSAQQFIRKGLSDVLMHFIIIFAVSAILVIGFSFVLSLTIIRPIEELVVDVKRIGTGNFDAQITVEGKDEITDLANAFNKMISDLREYIKNLEIVTAEKERINGELSVAADIQNDMLPNISSKFNSREWVNMYAEMEPAKQVGGDFYDFFYLDEEETNLVFVIADVSGKGVPAALFMVIAKTLIKTQMLQGFNAAETLERVNNLLAEDNSLSMFVTIFLCTLNLKTGILCYANGGHNRPLALLANGPYQFMELKRGLPLGMLEGSKYKQCELQMHPGDRLYLYTDGVNEAMNPEGRELGNEAFLAAANKFRALPPEEFDNAIRKVIADFANGAEQSDDITSMAISFIRQRETT